MPFESPAPLSSPALLRHRPVAAGHLRAFEAVARHLSFRKAGEDLALSQPAISRQIQSLEDEIGVALFVRHTRAVQLTEAGRQLYRALRPSLDRIDQAVRQLRSEGGRRSVAITTFASFASMWALPQLEQFQNSQPEIDLRIDASDHYVDLHRSDQDLALRLGLRRDMPADATLLFEEQLVPMAHPSVLPAAGLRRIDELRGYSLIENQEDHRAWLSWQSWLERRQMGALEPKRWLRFNYVYQILQVALSGQGLLLARLPMMTESVLRGDLVEAFPGDPRMREQPPLAYWMVVNRHSQSRTEVRTVAQWLTEAARLTRERLAQRYPLENAAVG